MNIVIGSDHAGFDMKEHLKAYLERKGIAITDVGTRSEESVDYPDFGHAVADQVVAGKADLGIALCGSGNGINISANKHEGIRSALCWKREVAELARGHNNANVLALPARFINTDEAEDILDAFLNTEFEGGRHERRVEKIAL